MLRFLGFLLIAAGLFGLIKGPELLEGANSNVAATMLVFDRKQGGWLRGWQPGKAQLDPSQNPYRIEVEASFLPYANPDRALAGLTLSISAKGETVLEGSFDISLPSTSALGDNERKTSFTTPQFDVAQQGEYVVSVLPEEQEDLEMSSVSATIRSSLAKPDDSLRTPAIAGIVLGLALLGASMLPRSRNRSANRAGNTAANSDDDEAPPPPPAPPPAPARKWGRDASQ